MEKVLISKLGNHIGKKVTACGFVDTIRDQKKMQFIILRDHTGKVQLVHAKTNNSRISEIISSLTEESTIQVTGLLVGSPQIKLNGFEIQIEDIHVSSIAQKPLPITTDSSLEKQMDWRHLSLRDPATRLTFEVQTSLEIAMRDYWCINGFLQIHSPKLMETSSESGAELFQVPYFGKTASLAQSPQFYKQMAMASGLNKIFEIGPVFRANPSFTSRHDTEFTMLDMEISWIDSHEDVMQLEEEWLAHVLSATAHEHGNKVKEMLGVDMVVPTLPFPRITLSDARKVLAERGHFINHKEDLDPQGERMISDYVQEKYGHEFVFITDYPAEIRPFYHMRYPDSPEITKSYDLLWRGLEITTGAQREHRIDQLEKQAKEKGLDLKPLESYLNFFRYGCPPHGGCGISITRMLMILLHKKNVREVTYLYRGPNRLKP